MAAEAGPSMSGGEEPVHKKLQPTVRGKAPQKEFLWAGKVTEAQKVPAWDSYPLWDMAVSKEHRAPGSETPLLTASLQDSHTSRQI